jgi:hypothetical protein
MAQEKEVTENFGDFENRAGLDFFHVLAITAIPGRLVDLDVPFFENPVNLLDLLGGDDLTKTHGLHIVGRNHDGHLIIDNLKDVELLLLAADILLLDALDDSNTVSRINRIVSYFKHELKPPKQLPA